MHAAICSTYYTGIVKNRIGYGFKSEAYSILDTYFNCSQFFGIAKF